MLENGSMGLTLELMCLVRLLLAALCGMLIGVERQTRMKGAGMKTHMMVALGSALMMLVSKYGFFDVISVASASVDVSRVAASIASGVGFLGAGVIFVRRESIIGLTTAAGLWATTGVGMAVGAGMYLLGVATTAFMLVAQILFHCIPLGHSSNVTELSIIIADIPNTISEIQHWLSSRRIRVTELHTHHLENETESITLFLQLPRGFDKNEFLLMQPQIEAIRSLEI